MIGPALNHPVAKEWGEKADNYFGLLRLPPQDAIKRRFNGVLSRFIIWSILYGPGAALGLGLLGLELPGRN